MPVVRTVVRIWKVFCYTLGTAAVVFALVQSWFAAHILWWRYFNPSATSFMAARLEALRQVEPDAVLKHQWVAYDQIAVTLKRAVIVAEDARFAEHEGFDWEGIQRALERNQKRGKVIAGGSTITQQLAKNLFLSGERSYVRKAQEALITMMLETFLDKRRILELYLNLAEWGDGVFGAEAAANHYYRSVAARLTPEQAARLAAMLPRPRYYDKNRGSAFLAGHSARILARMPAATLP